LRFVRSPIVLELRTFAQEAITAEGTTLPTEFCLFTPGVHDSTKGPWLWDADAARRVMSVYEKHGVDIMIDLNHDSQNPAIRKARADAADAMGYFRLEMRGGALWMVDIRWTPAGAERLLSKKQRYFSPTFWSEKETDRVVELVNVAIVADPATHDARPLVAANRFGLVPLNAETRARARELLKR
jgi:phage I-like protein